MKLRPQPILAISKNVSMIERARNAIGRTWSMSVGLLEVLRCIRFLFFFLLLNIVYY